MATAIYAPPRFETAADMIEQLGDIPPGRIRMWPPPGEATEADVIYLHDRCNRLYELVDGVLVEKPMGYRESAIASVIGEILGSHVRSRRLGVVAGADGMMRLTTGLVRMPDVSYSSWSRFPERRLPDAPIPDLAPDLAVEVLSRSNTSAEMARKIGEYFASGTQLVWLVDPDSRSATAFTGPEHAVEVPPDGELDGGRVLPGFRLRLRDVFALIEEPAEGNGDAA